MNRPTMTARALCRRSVADALSTRGRVISRFGTAISPGKTIPTNVEDSSIAYTAAATRIQPGGSRAKPIK